MDWKCWHIHDKIDEWVIVKLGEVLKVLTTERPENPFYNLAFEEAFYKALKEPVLRIWRNDKVIVIGRHQCALLEVNAKEAEKFGVKLVRRFTGGGAVYHDIGNVNYSIVMPKGILGIKNIEEAFKFVGNIVIEVLKNMGISNVNYRPLNDIEISGLKVSGMAAAWTENKLFVHGAILVGSNLSILQKVLKISKEKVSDKKFVSSRTRTVITLGEVLKRKIVFDEIIENFSEAFSKALGFRDYSIDNSYEEVSELANDLYKNKYSRTSWNLKYLNFVKESFPEDEIKALLNIAKP